LKYVNGIEGYLMKLGRSHMREALLGPSRHSIGEL
jgi:hypothetical protein